MHINNINIVAMFGHLQLMLLQLELGIARFIFGRRILRRGADRRWWVRPWLLRRPVLGHYDRLLRELRTEDLGSYNNFLRVSPELFDEIVARISPAIEKEDTFYRKALSPGLKVAITLRYLATGDSYATLQYDFRVGKSSISRLIPEVCDAIINTYQDEEICCPTTPQQWQEKAKVFQQTWNVPHAMGAMDGKHVAIRCPMGSGTQYYNYKGFYSIILFALVDADYKYLWVDVGTNGSCSDAQVFNRSELKAAIEDDSIGFPPASRLPGETRMLPYYLLGDDAFALKPWLMKPYSRRNMTHGQRIFNYRLSRGRRVVENVFGITAARFQVLLGTMRQKPEIVTKVTLACCILHNILRRNDKAHASLMDSEDADHNLVPGAWRLEGQLVDAGHIAAANNSSSAAGKLQRLYLTNYLNSNRGSVSWQERMI